MRGRGDQSVAFKSDSAENSGVLNTVILYLKDVLHVPQATIILLFMRTLDDEGLEYFRQGRYDLNVWGGSQISG